MLLLKDIQPKTFVFAVLAAIVGSFIFSFCIFYFDASYFDNDIIRRYQVQKLDHLDGVQTIIVGDSSAGNAIDAQYLEELTGTSTKSLALTGSFGLAGTFEMMNRALEKDPDLKNIIIIQTLDIWRRPFAPEAVFKFGCGRHLALWADQFSKNQYIECLEYSTQFKNILRFIRHLAQSTPLGPYWKETTRVTTIDPHYDYLGQEGETYANGGKLVTSEDDLKDLIDPSNITVFHTMDRWCGEHHVHCIFLNGPMHEEVSRRGHSSIEKIQQALQGVKNITVIPKVFVYPKSMIGDSVDHIQVLFKKQVTKDYFEAFDTY